MLSYMLPVEEKSPSVTAASAAAAAARNLSLNLNNPANPGGSSSSSSKQFKDAGSVASNGTARVTSSSGKVIKSAIKTNHRYQLVSSSSSSVEENGSGSGNGSAVTNGKKKFSKRNGSEEPVHNGGGNAAEDLSDEHTSLLGGGTTGSSKSVKSDKNFNNLIVVNGNVNGGKLASVLKKNGSAGNGTAATVNGDGPLKVVTTTTNGAYSAVRSSENDEEEDDEEDEAESESRYRGEEEDEEFDLVVAANNRKNTGVITAKMSTSASVTRNLNGINGNGAGATPQQQSSVETPSSGIIVDTSDADSEQTAVSGVSGGGGGGKKVKMNKLGGSKNVTLKRVSFGSSKGSMVETLVFETPTPLPEHAEREFFHSPAVLAGAGTTVNSVHHYQQHHHHLPHYHHPMQQQQPHPHQQQGQSQQSDSSLVGLDDSGIELQEEVERSKVRVSFFQSSKPQSISPPESLLFGGQNLIHFGPGSGGGGGGYDNNNTLLDSSYITSAALNQQYDSLLAGHHNHNSSTFQYNPDDPTSMAAVMAYDRQMSTESGWDNPFRPGGDLSREADEIVNLIKGGKPITPTGDQSLLNGSAPKDNSHGPTENGGSTVVDGVATKLESTQLQSQQPNGTKSPQKDAAPAATAASPQKNGSTPAAASQSPAAATNQTQVSNQVIPGPQSASHVVIDEKKKKKCACCVIQ